MMINHTYLRGGVNMGKTLSVANIQTSLTREQKEAVGLLSIGTFLEYFDLMLYVHMAVLLNELFFPKTDPFTASILTAFSFCSTYLLRPVGALIFGWIGDNIGRKQTVVITTFMMALSSMTMFILPTYAQIGITATWIVTICRLIQGMSSMGEIVGAELYLTELTRPPKQYSTVALISVMSTLGLFAALGVATIVTKYSFNWRYAFLFGAGIALIGSVARGALRETPEFVDARKRLMIQTDLKDLGKINKKVAFSYFCLEIGYPIWMYVSLIHYGTVLKNNFNYSAGSVIGHNLIIATASLLTGFFILFLVTKIHPLQIMKIRATIFTIFLPFFIFLLESKMSVLNILFLQLFIKIFNPAAFPSNSIIYKYFPVLKRFSTVSMLYAVSRVVMYLITSFGTIYLTKYFGTYGLLILIVPVLICYFYGLNTFINLEKEAGNYLEKKSFWSIVYLNNLHYSGK
jgi:MHS family proline/betaine transporter-like MFS transporter